MDTPDATTSDHFHDGLPASVAGLSVDQDPRRTEALHGRRSEG